ncbi:hypothetical protein OBBRIDRAFT_704624, partial [Obba rivulosa]
AWQHLCEHYEEKGKQPIAYLIGKLFRGTLSDESLLEQQLNALCHKARTLVSLSFPLDDSLVAATIVISLPTLYATLR